MPPNHDRIALMSEIAGESYCSGESVFFICTVSLREFAIGHRVRIHQWTPPKYVEV